MGGSGAVAPGQVSPWAAGEVVVADDYQRPAVHSAQRAAVADAARGLSAGNDGSALLLRLARRGAMVGYQLPAAIGLSGGGRPRGLAQRGYDAGKKIKGRKRHILTDTGGLLVTALVHTADIQDRDGEPDVLASIRASFPWLRHVFADGGYGGDKLRDAMAGHGLWTIKIIGGPTPPKALCCCLAAGSWSERWLRRPSARLARTKPAPLQGLRDHPRKLNRMALHGRRSTHDPKARNPLINIRNIMSQTLNWR